jgi:hypothetical protein
MTDLLHNLRAMRAHAAQRDWRTLDEAIAEIGRAESEILRYERDMARARFDRCVKILARIHAVINPPQLQLDDGRVMRFVNPLANDVLQKLSDQIRAIPDEIDRERDSSLDDATDAALAAERRE